MDVNISALEHKIELVVAFCQQLRDQNTALRERLAGLEAENHSLAERMTVARERLETMMERLPAE
jgi:cell division protein ZapB